MTDEERRFTNGRVKSGEGPMFLTIISVMEAFLDQIGSTVRPAPPVGIIIAIL
jgi:hypothetical protein